MKNPVAVLALVTLVFLAGCTETPEGGESPTYNSGSSGSGSTTTSGDHISITFVNFPTSIEVDEEISFSFEVDANVNVQDVEVLMYDFGSYIESSCDGRNRLGDMVRGEKKTRTCSMEVLGTPTQDISQNMKYEINFKVEEVSAELSLKVYDDVEFERESPRPDSDSQSLGKFGTFSLEPKNVEEGKPINLELRFDDDTLIKNDVCDCTIEKVTVSVPLGFVAQGLSGWTKRSCGSNECYSTTNLNTPKNEEFTLLISGVTRSNEFYIGAIVEGIWEYSSGSKSFTILRNEEIE